LYAADSDPTLATVQGVVSQVQTAAADSGQALRSAAADNIYFFTCCALSALVLVVLWKRGWLSQRALASSARDVKPHNALVWLTCGGLIWMTALASAGAAMGLSGMQMGTWSGSLKAQAILMLASYGGGISVGILLMYLLHASAPAAGLKVHVKSLAQGGLVMIVAWPMVAVVGMLAVWVSSRVAGTKPPTLAHPTLQTLVDNPSDVWAWTLAALAVIGAPIQEEIMYRACLQSAILRATNHAAFSVIITSVLFAAAHLVGSVAVPVHAAVTLFFLSLTFGYVFERTGKLGVVIGMHILFNAANVAIAVLASR
jgi:membrane protease YdiL (CAAX protease family)